MNAVTLFDLAQSVRDSVNQIDPETGELVETYSQSRELFQNKAIACVAYAKEEGAAIEAAKTMIKEMQARIESKERRLDGFKRYMADCMKATGILEVRHDTGLFGAKLYIGRDESVLIDETAKFPASLCNDPKPPAPSKSKIKAAIKAGEAVAGARIERRDRLTIT